MLQDNDLDLKTNILDHNSWDASYWIACWCYKLNDENWRQAPYDDSVPSSSNKTYFYNFLVIVRVLRQTYLATYPCKGSCTEYFWCWVVWDSHSEVCHNIASLPPTLSSRFHHQDSLFKCRDHWSISFSLSIFFRGVITKFYSHM